MLAGLRPESAQTTSMLISAKDGKESNTFNALFKRLVRASKTGDRRLLLTPFTTYDSSIYDG